MMLYLLSFIIIFAIVFYKLSSRRVKQNLENKIALITGGARGLGQQICHSLAKRGCNVIIADINSCDETIEQLKSYNVRVKAYKVDISKPKEILELRERVTNEFGNVDILINNAALVPVSISILNQTYEEIEKLMSVNVNAVIFMSKCFLENMIKRRQGHIVSISSLQGIYPFPHSVAYSSSKFAVTGFMLSLKEYLRKEKFGKIYTTTIHPNVMATTDEIVKVINTSKLSISKCFKHDIKAYFFSTPIMNVEKCADKIVDAIEECKSFITLPSFYSLLVPMFNLMPFRCQHFIRDYIRDESSWLVKGYRK